MCHVCGDPSCHYGEYCDGGKVLTPYQKGRAESSLSPRSRNPYDPDSLCAADWLRGWDDGQTSQEG